MSARASLIAGILAGMAVLGACSGALYWLLMPGRFPILELQVRGELARTNVADVEAALGRMAGNGAANFFSADLAAARAGVERLPWVRRVSLRRAWPARLEVSVEEHVALARWAAGDEMGVLVNVQGERFSAKTQEALPTFIGPPGSSAEVARRYRRFAEIVAPLGVAIDRVVLTPRQAWQLRLASGLHVMLGRDADAAEARLRQFVQHYPKARANDYVDLRYPNGFAVRVPDWNG